MYKELEISSDISPRKLNNAVKTGLLTLTAAELRGRGAGLSVHPESYCKLMKAKNNGKGARIHITLDEVKYPFEVAKGGSLYGGSIWGRIWNDIKSVYKIAKDSGALTAGADALVAPATAYLGPQGAIAARAGLKALTGIGVNGELQEEDLQGGSMQDVLNKAKQYLAYLKKRGILTDIVDEIENKALEHAKTDEHKSLVKQTRSAVRERFGVGFEAQASKKKPKARFVKGSQEAKDHMAALRAKRLQNKGDLKAGSFRLD